MRRVFPRFVPIAAGLALSTLACTGSGDDCASPPVAAGAPDATTQDGGEAGAPDGTAPLDASALDDGEAGPARPTSVALRLANWAPDAAGVDFCIAPHGTSAFRGPLLAGLAATLEEGGTDAGPSAVPFPQESAYVLVPPGTYDARLVAGGATDCTTGLLADAPAPPLAAGQALTVAVMGRVHANTLALVTYPDDTEPAPAPEGGAVGIAARAIHAAPSLPALDVGTTTTTTPPGGGPLVAPFFISIAYKNSSASATNAGVAMVDPNGYGPAPAFTALSVTARPSGAPNNLALTGVVSVGGGAVVTFVVVETLSHDAGSPTAQIIECLDNAGSLGLTGSCSLISPVQM
jgi:Domain of unknown function (DUF4397)